VSDAAVNAPRLAGVSALVVGGGQTPGETIGNGRAIATLFARHGASVMVVDRVLERAEATVADIVTAGGTALAREADVTNSEDCRAMVEATTAAFGTLDVLVNNVGIGGGDGGPVSLPEDVWDRIQEVNLKSMYLSCKHALPVMRAQGRGAIVNISSVAATCSTGMLAYKTSKAGVNALTHAVAMGNARHGIRVNGIMPGLMDTPMAVDAAATAAGVERAEVAARRDAQVPLRGRQGTAWDVAHAALYLASEEARFVTAVTLPVDGGQSGRIG
jgi:NAD(P)-dependent dehydrogenase (short-subunit alcohol dehydrogenase family)